MEVPARRQALLIGYGLSLALALVLVVVVAGGVEARSTAEHQSARPDLFHPETGLRIARQRAPTPDDVPGARRIDANMVRKQMQRGALLLDVAPALHSRFDDLDGTWLVGAEHLSLPGAIWLPETGRGVLTPAMQAYLAENVAARAPTPDTPIVVFCQADCWMSWNAVQRLTGMGYTQVQWFAEGVDGWLDQGWSLFPVEPLPVLIE